MITYTEYNLIANYRHHLFLLEEINLTVDNIVSGVKYCVGNSPLPEDQNFEYFDNLMDAIDFFIGCIYKLEE